MPQPLEVYCIRPDITQAVRVVNRYMNNLGKMHWGVVKWILRYMQSTKRMTLCFRSGDIKLKGFVDADLAGDVNNINSTTGYVYTLKGIAVNWVSQLQKVVALSTTKTEYIASTKASKGMIWLQGFLEELGKKQENNVLYSDSQSVIHLAKNPSFHVRTKHIQTKYRFIRSLLEYKALRLQKIHENKNPVDMLTKTVTIEKLKLCSTSIDLQTQKKRDELLH